MHIILDNSGMRGRWRDPLLLVTLVFLALVIACSFGKGPMRTKKTNQARKTNGLPA
jgi:hypothetical protein